LRGRPAQADGASDDPDVLVPPILTSQGEKAERRRARYQGDSTREELYFNYGKYAEARMGRGELLPVRQGGATSLCTSSHIVLG
jgi:hypothetical protein